MLVPNRQNILIALAFPLAVAAAQSPAKPVFENGMAQIVPAFADTSTWIRQHLWVETNFDSDRDGKPDRVHVDVVRPRQTETEGLKVPVLYGASPYYAGTARGQVNWNVKTELNAVPEPRGKMNNPDYRPGRTVISNALVGEWVRRGFAVVHSEQPGTGQSQGCPTVGDDPERMPMKFVIDWLNGRAKGYTSPTSTEEVKATSWSTGKVGMMGTSYEGTLPLAAATTGVPGLEVVIPIAPNTSYYHYYRSNGLVRSPGGYLGEDVDVLYDFIASGAPEGRDNCDKLYKNGLFAEKQDRVTGDYNEFWEKRDLLPFVKNIKAAVLLAHGLNDYNVVPSHSVRIYDEMKARGLPVSMYLHQGGHGGPPPLETQNRWFSHYLYGIDNGVEKDPPLMVSFTMPVPGGRGGAGRGGAPPPMPTSFGGFPVPGTSAATLFPSPGGNGIGKFSTTAVRGTERLRDDASVSGSDHAAASGSAARLAWATAPLADSVHYSGAARITLRVASSAPATNLSVWLVTLPFDSARVGSQSRAGLIARGWADIQNYKSLTKGGDYNSKASGEKLVPGRFYDVTFDLEPADKFIPAGKQLAILVFSSDQEFTLAPKAGAELTVDLAGSRFSIPVVGGLKALMPATVP
jgi:X-Pro dipeptidyl-peptidase